MNQVKIGKTIYKIVSTESKEEYTVYVIQKGKTQKDLIYNSKKNRYELWNANSSKPCNPTFLGEETEKEQPKKSISKITTKEEFAPQRIRKNAHRKIEDLAKNTLGVKVSCLENGFDPKACDRLSCKTIIDYLESGAKLCQTSLNTYNLKVHANLYFNIETALK